MSGNIAPLARDWIEAKQEEDYARARRLEIESQMIGAIDIPAEGSRTHKVERYKITVTQPVSRKVDMAEWVKVGLDLPESLRPIKTKIEADPAGCKYLAENQPNVWARISSAFTTTPGKVGFKVEEI